MISFNQEMGDLIALTNIQMAMHPSYTFQSRMCAMANNDIVMGRGKMT